MGIKKGDVLRQKVHVVQGPVKQVAYDDEKGEFKYLVAFAEADGTVTERWFDAKDVEVVATAEEQGEQQ